MTCIRTLYKAFKSTTSTLISYSIPHHPQTVVAAGCIGWYANRVLLTFGPGFLAQFFMSKAYFGSHALGWWMGALIVAPTMVPSITPILAYVGTSTAIWMTCVTCNIVARHFFKSKQTVTTDEALCQKNKSLSPSSSSPLIQKNAFAIACKN